MIEEMQFGQVSCDFLPLDEFEQTLNQWLTTDGFHHVVTLNPEMVMQAEEDAEFRQALADADIRVPDGAGLVWAHWYIRSQFWSLMPSLLAFSFRQVERITGVETVHLVAKLCEQQQTPLYLLGGTLYQVSTTAKKLRQEFPRLTVYTSADHRFDLAGPPEILVDIQAKKPGALLVAYGAPKQTLWIAKHRHDLSSVRIAVGVGGAFAILSEDKPRAPRWLRQLNLEWLWRLFLEPSRFPRIWRATIQFPLLIKQQKAAAPPVFPAQ